MSDPITRALLCGLGLASLTKDAIKKTAEELADHSKLSEEEGRKLVKDLQRRSGEAQKALEETVETAVKKVLKSLNLEVAQDKAKRGKSGKKGPRKGSAS
ncbi:MAG: hypothetical protein ABSF29_14520 [Tepidisphaeraceae bacterium]|jgi:polyhydroxyalkanoate synthesis regulator phasin